MSPRDDLVTAFDRWVLDPDRGPDVDVPVHARGRGGAGSDRWPVADVLYELADDERPVDERVGAALRLPATATYALAARVLWTTRHVWAAAGARTAG